MPLVLADRRRPAQPEIEKPVEPVMQQRIEPAAKFLLAGCRLRARTAELIGRTLDPGRCDACGYLRMELEAIDL